MATIYEANGGIHLRIYSSVDINTGEPLGSNEKGRPVRRQQQKMIARIDDGQFKNEKTESARRLALDEEAKIKQMERAAAAGDTKPSGDMTVSDFFHMIFMPWVRAEKAKSTAKTYEVYWEHYLKDHFKPSKTLKSYEAYMGTNFLQQLCKKYADNTVSHARALASGIFTHAAAKNYIPHNPWRDVQKLSTGQPTKETYAYTQPEVERIIEALERVEGRESPNAQLAAIIVSVGFYAGLRPSEIAALRWENVTDTTLIIKHAYVNGDFKGTKTSKKGKPPKNRRVDMLPALRNAMRLWAAQQSHPKTGWVFQNRNGSPVNINTLAARTIAETCRAAGLDWHSMYALRRGFCTMMMQAGATVEEVADAAGNSRDVIYEHYFKDKTNKLATKGIAKLAAALDENKSATGRKVREPLELAEVNQ